jgi:hypothetical protein
LPWAASAVVAGTLLSASMADASVIRISEGNFNASAGLITFSEFPLGTVNPTYAPADYGGDPLTAPTVTTGGFFVGQSLSATPAIDCPGAAASACVVGSPTGPLALDPGAPSTFITTDSANPTSPVLSGTPRFNGPIALLFSVPQLAVGFSGGFFDAVGSTGITAFGVDGSFLGTIINEGTGIEFLGLISASNVAEIAGVFLDLVGAEPAGFAIDNVRFGVAGQVEPPHGVIPLPAGLPLLLGGLGMLAFLRGRRQA